MAFAIAFSMVANWLTDWIFQRTDQKESKLPAIKSFPIGTDKTLDHADEKRIITHPDRGTSRHAVISGDVFDRY